ncbi:hypothetical protein HN587_06245 [Candidatus Woesearchaeota archaeon]|jgi:hypothetical protein|nr:hypothetical protein [Candidatus Woesearchaeota archaeon]
MEKRGNWQIYIKFVGLLLIYLWILLPIHASSVYANIQNVSATGQHGVTGVRRTNDYTQIELDLINNSNYVEPNSLKLLEYTSEMFECTYNNKTFIHHCISLIDEILEPGKYVYQIQRFSSGGTISEELDFAQFIVDNIPPKIQSFNVIQNESGVYANYSSIDLGCVDCGLECAGIGKVIFSIDSVQKGEAIFNTSSCAITNTTKIEVNGLEGIFETKKICIDVYDRLNQKTKECTNITIDMKIPELKNISLNLGNKEIKYFKGDPLMNAELKISFYEDSILNLSSLNLDMSSLNIRPEYQEAYKEIKAQTNYPIITFGGCSNGTANYSEQDTIPTQLSGEIECTWGGIVVYFSEEQTPVVKIDVSDEIGKKLSTTHELPITIDRESPLVQNIITSNVDENGKSWMGLNPDNITALIQENKSGIYNKKIIMDFSSLGEQNVTDNFDKTKILPNNCTEGWTCLWTNIIVDPKTHNSGDILQLTIINPSQDDAGNAVDGKTTTSIFYDSTPPKIDNESILRPYACPVTGETIDIEFNVTETMSGEVSVEFYAQNISLNSFPQKGECEKIEDAYGQWNCKLSIDNLVSYYVKDQIRIDAIDRAGNNATFFIEQEVCESVNGTPNVVSADILEGSMFPSKLDKITSGYLSYPVFFQIMLNHAETVAVQKIDVESCNLSEGSITDEYVVTPLEFIQPLIGIKISLDADAVANVSETIMTCKLNLKVRAGTKVYSQPEYEEVEIPLQLTGTIFGGLNESMQNTLEGIESDIEDIQSDIDGYEDALAFFGTLCSLVEILVYLIQAMQIIKMLLWIVGWIVYAVMLVVKQGDLVEAGKLPHTIYYDICAIIDKVSTTIVTLTYQFDAKIWTPDVYTSPGFYLKLLCAWATCRFSEADNFIQTFAGTGTSSGSQFKYSYENEKGPSGDKLNFGEAVFSYDWSVYKSITVARGFGCIPGIVYGLKKKKQVTCMQRNCVRDYVSSGFSPAHCNEMKDARECLYVDSAASRMVDGPQAYAWFQGLNEWLIGQVVGSLMAALMDYFDCGCPCGLTTSNCASSGASTLFDTKTGAYGQIEKACGKSDGKDTQGFLLESWRSFVCGITLSLALFLELGDWINWSDLEWNYYDNSLEGEDYCNQ